jgi:hypothetical protein
MKKLIFAIFSIALIFVACKKATTILEPNQVKKTKKTRTNIDSILFNNHYYHIVDGMLQFKSIDEYDNLFGTENEDIDPSLLQQFADNVKESDAMNTYWESRNLPLDSIHYSFIGNIVNQNGIIRIDDYLLLLDFVHEKVFITVANNVQGLLNAVQGNVASNIEIFTMKDDVASEIRTRKKGWLCKERYAKLDQYGQSLQTLSQVWYPGPINAYGIVSLSHEVRYASYGIYYELFSRVVAVPVPYATEYFKFVTTYSWVRRCSNKTGGWTYTDDFTGSAIDHCKRKCYSNVRALKHYDIKSTLTSPSAPGLTNIVQIQD